LRNSIVFKTSFIIVILQIAISNALYNLDKDADNATIKKFIAKDNIKAVYIYDSTSDNSFAVGYKNNV